MYFDLLPPDGVSRWTGGVGVEAAEVDGVDEKYEEIFGYELFITGFLGFLRPPPPPGVRAFLAGLYRPGSRGAGATKCLAVAEMAACRNNTCIATDST